MIEQKHTPGPWSYEGGDNDSCEVNAGSTTISIPRWDKNTGVHVIDRDEMEANAKLIAAAPDLLAIAIRVKNINKIAREHMSDDLFISIESAINKTTL